MGYIVYAINQNGEGFTQRIGVFAELSDISIHVSTFAPDVVLEIEETDEVPKDPDLGKTSQATPVPPISPTGSTIPNLVAK